MRSDRLYRCAVGAESARIGHNARMNATTIHSYRHAACALALAMVMTSFSLPPVAVENRLLAAQEVNPCALLTADEIQKALAPSVTIKDGRVEAGKVGSTSCSYEWGAAGGSGKSVLHLVVTEATTVYLGMSAALITKTFLAEKEVTSVPNIGDAAVFKSDAPTRGTAKAYVKKKILEVAYESRDARAQKEKLVALLKSAAERL
jgi:hypothetical protein